MAEEFREMETWRSPKWERRTMFGAPSFPTLTAQKKGLEDGAPTGPCAGQPSAIGRVESATEDEANFIDHKKVAYVVAREHVIVES